MKKLFFLMGIFLLAACAKKPSLVEDKKTEPVPEMSSEKIAIIPQPVIVKRLGGSFRLNADTKIVASDASGIQNAAILNDSLNANHGLSLGVTSEDLKKNSIILINDPNGENGEEGYGLKVEPDAIQIKGSAKGVFYGIQSLLQMIPVDGAGEISIPAAEVSDTPRFAYRGMHLDTARHFMPVDFIKKYIGLLAQYKFNYFHWHLTDDQGWRIEIDKYPKLTSIGSKRRETVRGKSYRPYVGDGIPVEGFYTKDEIREIVSFAESRNVSIVPEIDLPGHSSAALAAYPEFGCDASYDYRVRTTWGGFPDVFCPTEQTFAFLEDVLGEVSDLFPNSKYMHIGGDEVMLDQWARSAFVQNLKKQQNLKTDKELQGWFFARLAQFLSSRGKTAIGWDEIIETGISGELTVMNWREIEHGIQSAKAGHKVIMTPSDYTYLDHPQGDPATEPLSLGKRVSLRDVYQFDPIPFSLRNKPEARNIIGGQGCVWTEFIKNPEDVEYMAFPRAIALAEVLWTRVSRRDFVEFSERLLQHLGRLDRAKVNYRIPEPFGLSEQTVVADNRAIINLTTAIKNARIHYTLDGSDPNENSSVYRAPFFVPLAGGQVIELRCKIFAEDGRESSVFIGRYSQRPISNFSDPKRLGKSN